MFPSLWWPRIGGVLVPWRAPFFGWGASCRDLWSRL